jgi:hypothetical protein
MSSRLKELKEIVAKMVMKSSPTLLKKMRGHECKIVNITM